MSNQYVFGGESFTHFIEKSWYLVEILQRHTASNTIIELVKWESRHLIAVLEQAQFALDSYFLTVTGLTKKYSLSMMCVYCLDETSKYFFSVLGQDAC